MSTPFSTINLQKTTMHILHQNMTEIISQFDQYARTNEVVDIKEVILCSVISACLLMYQLTRVQYFNINCYCCYSVSIDISPYHF